MEDPMVLVEWHDASQTDDEVTAGDPMGADCATLGWLVADRDDGIVIAMSRDNDAGTITYRKGFSIPRAYIRSMTRIRRGRKE